MARSLHNYREVCIWLKIHRGNQMAKARGLGELKIGNQYGEIVEKKSSLPVALPPFLRTRLAVMSWQ